LDLSLVTHALVLDSGHKNFTVIQTASFLNLHSLIFLCKMDEVYFQGM